MSNVRKIAYQALLIWAVWTLFALFSASQSALIRSYRPDPKIDWKPLLAYNFLDCYVWALLTPVIFWVASRLVEKRLVVMIPLLLLASFAFAVADFGILLPLLPQIGYKVTSNTLGAMFRNRLHSSILTAWVLFGARYALEYHERYRHREIVASQLEARLAEAQLEVLKMQLQPHFLFNTLHAISALLYRDHEAADRMITRLSDFLRLTLDSAGVQEVSLKRELESLDKYLEIEQVRFGSRLQIRRNIAPETLDLLVPNLVLQPLAENAVRHGIAPHAAGGQIDLNARRENRLLVIEVIDEGPGPAGAIREGVGLTNIRSRLAHLYGGLARLELGKSPKGGFRACLVIPAHANPDR